MLDPSAIPRLQQPLPDDDLLTHSLKQNGRTEQDQIDAMAAEAVKQAENAFRVMMKPILSIVDSADDLETLQEVLKDEKTVKKLYGKMDSLELEDVLHQAIYLSELIGRSME